MMNFRATQEKGREDLFFYETCQEGRLIINWERKEGRSHALVNCIPIAGGSVLCQRDRRHRDGKYRSCVHRRVAVQCQHWHVGDSDIADE